MEKNYQCTCGITTKYICAKCTKYYNTVVQSISEKDVVEMLQKEHDHPCCMDYDEDDLPF